VSPWTIVRLSQIHSPALWYPGQQVLIPGEGEGYLPAPFRSIEVQPLPVEQGNTLAVSVKTTQPVSLEGRLFEEGVQFSEDAGTYHALVGVHVFTEPGLYELSLRAVDDAGQRTTVTTGVVIEEGWFGYERIDLPSTTDSLLEPEVIAAERERIEALRTTYTAERHWSVPFQRPCEGPISSYFGTHRAYNTGPYTSYHSGVDFRAPGGTPVYAPAGGVVLLADGLNVRGNAIIIDHGWGVVSGYWHLSAIEVEPGQRVERGQQIGRVGNTGLSTGAHLHWQMWVGGVSVNGLPWLDELSPLASPEDQSPGG
jgi:murein DD-endopeptidase MepM/ murein hydrolase activator NlpD